MKKRTAACMASIVLTFGTFIAYADNIRSSKNNCDRLVSKSKECIEKSLAHELKKFRCRLFELFSDQNTFFSNKTELLGLHLKEDVAAKDKESALLFKDFLLKRLHHLEDQLGLFIDGEFGSLKDLICHKTKEIDCALNNIICQSKEIDGEIKCIADMFSAYLSALSTYYAEFNPTLAEALNSLSQAVIACKGVGPECVSVDPS